MVGGRGRGAVGGAGWSSALGGGGGSRRGRSADAEVREGEMGAGAVKHQTGPEAMQSLGAEYMSVRKGASWWSIRLNVLFPDCKGHLQPHPGERSGGLKRELEKPLQAV